MFEPIIVNDDLKRIFRISIALVSKTVNMDKIKDQNTNVGK